MSKIINNFLLIILLVISVVNKTYSKEDFYKVAIILPMDHQAMNYIVAGFKKELSVERNKKYKLKIYNAQGDSNLMKSIFQQIARSDYDVVVPIGTNATQFAIKMVKDQTIISIAAKLSKKYKAQNFINVEDQITMKKFVSLINAVIHHPKYLTLIHSNDVRMFQQSKLLIEELKNEKCEVQVISVQNISDILSSLKSINNKSQAIIILKDHLVVSGIASIIKEAKKIGIPVIASDEGSVKNGADVAIGLKEEELGVAAAKILISFNNATENNDNIMLDFMIFKNKFSSVHINEDKLQNEKLLIIE